MRYRTLLIIITLPIVLFVFGVWLTYPPPPRFAVGDTCRILGNPRILSVQQRECRWTFDHGDYLLPKKRWWYDVGIPSKDALMQERFLIPASSTHDPEVH